MCGESAQLMSSNGAIISAPKRKRRARGISEVTTSGPVSSSGAEPCTAQTSSVHDFVFVGLRWRDGLGFLAAATFIAAPIANLGLAPLGDRGHTRGLIASALLLGTAGSVWFAFATELWQFIGARTMIGFAFGLYQPASRGLILRNARAVGDGAGVELARLSGVDTAGFTIGPAIGALLVKFLGLRAPFLFVAIALPIAGFRLLTRLPMRPPNGSRTKELPTQRLALDLLRDAKVRIAVLLAIGNFLPVGVYDSLWARFLEDRGASTLFVGFSLSFYGIPYVLAATPGGRYVDRVGPLRAIKVALIGILPLVVLYGIMRDPWLIAILALLEASFGAIAQPAAQAAMAAACPGDRLSAGQGLASAAASLTAAATALIAAPTYARIGPTGVFAGAAVGIAIVMFSALGLARRLNWNARIRALSANDHH